MNFYNKKQIPEYVAVKFSEKDYGINKHKRLRLRQWVIDALGVILFYTLIIVGIVLINARLG